VKTGVAQTKYVGEELAPDNETFLIHESGSWRHREDAIALPFMDIEGSNRNDKYSRSANQELRSQNSGCLEK